MPADEPQFIAIIGNLTEGFNYVGPFETATEAQSWAIDWVPDDCWYEVVQLQDPPTNEPPTVEDCGP